jgi:hypothetical protein
MPACIFSHEVLGPLAAICATVVLCSMRTLPIKALMLVLKSTSSPDDG